MIPLKKLALGFAALTAFAMPAMAQYGARGHGYSGGSASYYDHFFILII